MNGAVSLLPDYTPHLTILVRVILIFNSSTAVIISPIRVLCFSYNRHLQNFTGSPPFLYRLITSIIYSCVDRSDDPVIAYLISRNEVDYCLSKVSTLSMCI